MRRKNLTAMLQAPSPAPPMQPQPITYFHPIQSAPPQFIHHGVPPPLQQVFHFNGPATINIFQQAPAASAPAEYPHGSLVSGQTIHGHAPLDGRPLNSRPAANSVLQAGIVSPLNQYASCSSRDHSIFGRDLPNNPQTTGRRSSALEPGQPPEGQASGHDGAPMSSRPGVPDAREYKDNDFIAQVKAELGFQKQHSTDEYTRAQAAEMEMLLGKSIRATSGNSSLSVMTSTELHGHLDSARPVPGPIFIPATEVTRKLGPYQDVTEMLNNYICEESATLYVQGQSPRKMAISEIKTFFPCKDEQTLSALNVLDFSPTDTADMPPTWLKSVQDTALLQHVEKFVSQLSSKQEGSRRAKVSQTSRVSWANFATPGAQTMPHRDAGGLDTHLRCQQGTLIYGWVDRPGDEDLRHWRQRCQDGQPAFTLGTQFRVLVMRPGDEIFFPGGIIHFVARSIKGGETLFFGGHVLRYSQLAQWIELVKDLDDNPETTNEDPVGLDQDIVPVARLLRMDEGAAATSNNESRINKWGGVEATRLFWQKLEEFYDLTREDIAKDARGKKRRGGAANKGIRPISRSSSTNTSPGEQATTASQVSARTTTRAKRPSQTDHEESRVQRGKRRSLRGKGLQTRKATSDET